MQVWVDGPVPGCLKEMETVGRGKARRSSVPCARNPPGTLTSNIWVSLLRGGGGGGDQLHKT